MTKDYWGYHLILDVKECAKDLATDSEYITKWIKDLVAEIDMVAFGEPNIIHFGHGEEHLSGWTAIQLIETSNIVAHFCDSYGDCYLDVFSCKEFDVDKVVNHFNKWFEPKEIQKMFLNRGVNRVVKEQDAA